MQVFDADTTRERLALPALIEALRRRFAEGCEAPTRHQHAIPTADGTAASLLLMPAWRAGHRLGVKVATVFPGNGSRGLPAVQAAYLLFDATTGTPIAQIDGGEITVRRTVAASALAASYLARADASRLLIVGAGRVARELAPAMRAVRGITNVEVWNRDAAKAQALAAQLREQGFDADATTDLAAAARRAHIVSTATLAAQPLIRG